MTFFVVTAAIMAVSILLIYKLCRFFGLELKWISLVLCAMMAFGVNGATIILSPFLDQSHYLKLTALVLVAAGVVTLINDYLLRREHRQLAAAGGAVLEVPEEAEGGEGPQAGALLAAAGSENQAGEKTEAGEALSQRLQEAMKANAPAEEPVAEQPEEKAGETFSEPATENPAEEPQAEEPQAEEPQAEEEHAEEPGEEPPAEEAAPSEEPASKAEAEAAPKEEPEAEPVVQEEPETAAEETAPQEDALPEPKAEPAQEPIEERKAITWEPDAAEAAVAELSSLDEILDFAYSNKEKDVSAAITAYRAAIDRYPDDSYAPFLIIELAGLYKERASYNEAINLYAESLGMPIIAGDDAMVQEFSKTLRYLGTVQDILNKHHALATPFSKLTPEILQEIEAEFARRQAK